MLVIRPEKLANNRVTFTDSSLVLLPLQIHVTFHSVLIIDRSHLVKYVGYTVLDAAERVPWCPEHCTHIDLPCGLVYAWVENLGDKVDSRRFKGVVSLEVHGQNEASTMKRGVNGAIDSQSPFSDVLAGTKVHHHSFLLVFFENG